MKSIQDEWRSYRDAVYPTGIGGQQSRECHRAFMAGAHAAFCAMRAVAARPDTEAAVTELEALAGECIVFGKQVGLKG